MQRLSLTEIFDRLLSHFGPQHWWPGDTPDEVLVGCVLAQNARWERVVPVIAGLKRRGLLSPASLRELSPEALAGLLKGSGTYRLKADYLLGLADLMVSLGWDGASDSMVIAPTDALREKLLDVRGIGPETADSILLYAFRRPVFVVDAYTRRILSRHGLIEGSESYGEIQRLFRGNIPVDVEMYNEYHALLVMCGKEYCRPRPRCDDCPLFEGLQNRL